MKKRLQYPLILLLVLGFLLPASIGHSQSEAEAGGLMMEQQEDATKSVLIKNGTRIKVSTTDGKTQSGMLTSVSDSSLVLGTQDIPFSKTTKVKIVKGEGSKIGGIAGIILGILGALVGFLFGLLGKYLLDTAPNNAEGCAAIFFGVLLLVLGIALGVVAAIFLIVGIVAFAAGKAAGRAFAMDGKWRMKRSK